MLDSSRIWRVRMLLKLTAHITAGYNSEYSKNSKQFVVLFCQMLSIASPWWLSPDDFRL